MTKVENFRKWAIMTFCTFIAAMQVAGNDYVYIFSGSGRFVQLDPENRIVVSAWNLEAAGEVGSFLPTVVYDGPVLEALEFDPEGRALYMVVPVQARIDAEGEKDHRILRVGLPFFNVLNEYEIEHKFGYQPNLLYDKQENKLLAEWQVFDFDLPEDSDYIFSFVLLDSWLNEIEAFEAKAAYKTETGEMAAVPQAGPEAEYDASENVIYSGDRVLRIGKESVVTKMSRAVELVSPRRRAEVEKFFSDKAQSPGQDIQFFLQSPAGKKVVITAVGDVGSMKKQLIYSYDLATKESGALIEAPGRDVVLYNDGLRILVREDELRLDPKSETGGILPWMSGRFWIYDAVSGELIVSMESELLRGDGKDVRYVCASPDGEYLVFQIPEWRLAVFRLADKSFWTPDVLIGISQQANFACVFTSR